MTKEQFESMVDMIPIAGCWIWKGKPEANGYCRLRVYGTRYLSHRYSYELYKGPVPNGLYVLHRCDVKCCVNPEHLYAGTCGDNVRDMLDRKGTSHYYNSGLTHCKRGHPLS